MYVNVSSTYIIFESILLKLNPSTIKLNITLLRKVIYQYIVGIIIYVTVIILHLILQQTSIIGRRTGEHLV